ncbi:hypothetical protein DIPPA_34930 [Diplonema papillatum]|nr:hypothetical protein DIPPA_34930 [Diplonema papillatum]|eukprot:gene16852-25838_t
MELLKVPEKATTRLRSLRDLYLKRDARSKTVCVDAVNTELQKLLGPVFNLEPATWDAVQDCTGLPSSEQLDARFYAAVRVLEDVLKAFAAACDEPHDWKNGFLPGSVADEPFLRFARAVARQPRLTAGDACAVAIAQHLPELVDFNAALQAHCAAARVRSVALALASSASAPDFAAAVAGTGSSALAAAVHGRAYPLAATDETKPQLPPPESSDEEQQQADPASRGQAAGVPAAKARGGIAKSGARRRKVEARRPVVAAAEGRAAKGRRRAARDVDEARLHAAVCAFFEGDAYLSSRAHCVETPLSRLARCDSLTAWLDLTPYLPCNYDFTQADPGASLSKVAMSSHASAAVPRKATVVAVLETLHRWYTIYLRHAAIEPRHTLSLLHELGCAAVLEDPRITVEVIVGETARRRGLCACAAIHEVPFTFQNVVDVACDCLTDMRRLAEGRSNRTARQYLTDEVNRAMTRRVLTVQPAAVQQVVDTLLEAATPPICGDECLSYAIKLRLDADDTALRELRLRSELRCGMLVSSVYEAIITVFPELIIPRRSAYLADVTPDVDLGMLALCRMHGIRQPPFLVETEFVLSKIVKCATSVHRAMWAYREETATEGWEGPDVLLKSRALQRALLACLRARNADGAGESFAHPVGCEEQWLEIFTEALPAVLGWYGAPGVETAGHLLLLAADFSLLDDACSGFGCDVDEKGRGISNLHLLGAVVKRGPPYRFVRLESLRSACGVAEKTLADTFAEGVVNVRHAPCDEPVRVFRYSFFARLYLTADRRFLSACARAKMTENLSPAPSGAGSSAVCEAVAAGLLKGVKNHRLWAVLADQLFAPPRGWPGSAAGPAPDAELSLQTCRRILRSGDVREPSAGHPGAVLAAIARVGEGYTLDKLAADLETGCGRGRRPFSLPPWELRCLTACPLTALETLRRVIDENRAEASGGRPCEAFASLPFFTCLDGVLHATVTCHALFREPDDPPGSLARPPAAEDYSREHLKAANLPALSRLLCLLVPNESAGDDEAAAARRGVVMDEFLRTLAGCERWYSKAELGFLYTRACLTAYTGTADEEQFMLVDAREYDEYSDSLRWRGTVADESFFWYAVSECFEGSALFSEDAGNHESRFWIAAAHCLAMQSVLLHTTPLDSPCLWSKGPLSILPDASNIEWTVALFRRVTTVIRRIAASYEVRFGDVGTVKADTFIAAAIDELRVSKAELESILGTSSRRCKQFTVGHWFKLHAWRVLVNTVFFYYDATGSGISATALYHHLHCPLRTSMVLHQYGTGPSAHAPFYLPYLQHPSRRVLQADGFSRFCCSLAFSASPN